MPKLYTDAQGIQVDPCTLYQVILARRSSAAPSRPPSPRRTV